MTSSTVLEQLAQQFTELDRQEQPVELIGSRAPDLTNEEAYQVQRLIVSKLIDQGGRLAGKKAGVTNEAAWPALGLTEPIYGHLFAHHQVAAGGTIPMNQLIRAILECEVAFRLGRDLTGPHITPADVLEATESVVAALEIVDFRMAAKPTLKEFLAYNVFASHFVLAPQPHLVAGLDLANLAVTLTKNGQVVTTATGAAVMGNPLNSVAWMANKLAQHGDHLKAGDIILSGTMTPAEPIQAGDYFEATFEQLGPVSVRFE